MSEGVICDGCSKEGRRRRMHYCPENWFFMEAIPEGQGPDDEGVIIMMACSVECAMSLWVSDKDGTWSLTATMTDDPDFETFKVTVPTIEEAASFWREGNGERFTKEMLDRACGRVST